MTADTIIPNPKNLQAFNRYTYVLNNPIRYTDPTGHYPDETDGSNANDFDGGQDSDGDWNGSRSGRERRDRDRGSSSTVTAQTITDMLNTIDGLISIRIGLNVSFTIGGFTFNYSLSMFSQGFESFEASVKVSVAQQKKALAKDTNKATHIFGKGLDKRKLRGFLNTFEGDKIRAYRSIRAHAQNLANQGKIDGQFEKVINVRGTNITIRGKVIDGKVDVGTAFIP